MAPAATVSPATLKAFLEPFDRRDLDAIMAFFAEDDSYGKIVE